MKTGNCWNDRHHTCKGGGLTNAKIDEMKKGNAVRYYCDCECHEAKEEVNARMESEVHQ